MKRLLGSTPKTIKDYFDEALAKIQAEEPVVQQLNRRGIWRNTDPRYTVGKRAHIIVFDSVDSHSCTAHVETKHGWSIQLYEEHFDVGTFISADDSWPNRLWWMYTPTKEDLLIEKEKQDGMG